MRLIAEVQLEVLPVFLMHLQFLFSEFSTQLLEGHYGCDGWALVRLCLVLI